MAEEIRPCNPQEMAEFVAVAAYVFNGALPDPEEPNSIAPEWTSCAFVDGKLATTFAVIPFTMRANGRAMPMAGVTSVGTWPEYRRRGNLRRIMTQSFADLRDKGQSLATLYASQAAIYQRYGYMGVTPGWRGRLNPLEVDWLPAAPGSPGAVRRVSFEDAYEQVKPLYVEYCADRTGLLHRAKVLWGLGMLRKDKARPRHIALYYDDDEPRGYVIYTLAEGGPNHRARNQRLNVMEVVALDTAAHTGLWRYVLAHDLVGEVTFSIPLDDPLPHLLNEPRLLHLEHNEGIYGRVTDVAPCFAGRGYDIPGEVIFAVTGDDLCDWNNGTYRLASDGEQAEVTRHAGPPQITFPIRSLAPVFFGSARPSMLARIGLAEGNPVALRLADELFATRHCAWCPDDF